MSSTACWSLDARTPSASPDHKPRVGLLRPPYRPMQQRLWRVWDITRRVMLIAVIGSITPDDLLQAATNVHRRLAHSRRKRQPYVRYPVRG